MRLNQVTIPCSDLDASLTFYKKLGLRQIVGNDHYARFECPDGESTMSIERVDGPARPGHTAVYFECDDLDGTYRWLQREGFAFEAPPVDQPWKWREAWLRDPYGNRVCLFHAGENRRNPPWRLP